MNEEDEMYRINCNSCKKQAPIKKETVITSVTKNDRWRVTGTCLLCGKSIGSLVSKEKFDYLSKNLVVGEENLKASQCPESQTEFLPLKDRSSV